MARKGIQPIPDALKRMDPGGALDQIRNLLLQVAETSTTTSGTTTTSPSPTPGPPGPPGPPAPAPAPDTPDLTPPPTPSGVIVSAGLDFVFITTDAPTFSMGHGYNRTLVYGVTYGGSGPLPTFGDAVLVHEFVGQVGSFAAEMGVQWHIWLKWRTNDGVLSVSPSGGANGAQVTTALLGNVHLGPLIVEAENLANGSVTGTKLADGAIEMTKFALGIRPPRVVNSLPITPFTGYAQGDTVVLTTDNKLYRFTGTDWTRAVDGTADIIANSITAGSIAAGAIGATQIAANAITTDKLLVTGRGAALNADPTVRDQSAWTNLGGDAPATFVSGVLDFPAGGSTALRAVSGARSRPFSADIIPIDSAKNYRMEAWFYRAAAGSPTCICYFAIAWYDADGVYLPSNSAQPGGAGSPAGWTSNGIYSYGGLVNATPPTGWTRYVFSFGPGETAQIPSNARFVRIGALLNNNNNTLAGDVLLSGVRLMEKASADLIVDGAIVANKLAANAIAVGTAAIQNGAIINAMIADATITNAKIVSLAASKILAGSIAVGEYIQSSDYVAGVSGWRWGGNTGEVGSAMIRGQLTAGQINANGLVIRDNSGAPILGVNEPLSASYIDALIGGGNLLRNSAFLLDSDSNGVPDYWTGTAFGTGITITRSIVAGGVHGTNALQLAVSGISGASTNLHTVTQALADGVAVTEGSPYSASVWFYTSTTSFRCRIVVQYIDAADTQIDTSTINATVTAANSWERVKIDGYVAPAGAVKARMFIGLARPSVGDTTTGTVRLSAPQLEPGELATGYAVGAVDKVGLDNPITSGNISTYIASAAIGSAYIADLAASKITAGNLQVGSYLRSTAYTPGSVGWAVNADGTAEFAATSIRGQLSAGNIVGASSAATFTNTAASVTSGQVASQQWPASAPELVLDIPNVGDDSTVKATFTGAFNVFTKSGLATEDAFFQFQMLLTLQSWNGSTWASNSVNESTFRVMTTLVASGQYVAPIAVSTLVENLPRTQTKMRAVMTIEAKFMRSTGVVIDAMQTASISGETQLQQLPN